MEQLRKTNKDFEIYSRNDSPRELMIPFINYEDQVFNNNIKEEIINEADVNNDNQLLEKSTILCKTEKDVNTMFDTEINIDKYLIEDCKSQGAVSTISHTSELMTCMNFDKKSNLCGNSLVCEVCKKSHYNENLGQNSYKCNTYDQGYLFDSDLKVHTQISANIRCFKCENYSETFSLKSSINNHMSTLSEENPYSCDICGKTYSVLSVLKRHSRTHTGEKSYKCDKCNKAFYRSDILKQHTFIHTGEKPYKCDLCYKGFSQSSNLKKHKVTHTRERYYKWNKYL